MLPLHSISDAFALEAKNDENAMTKELPLRCASWSGCELSDDTSLDENGCGHIKERRENRTGEADSDVKWDTARIGQPSHQLIPRSPIAVKVVAV